MKYMTGTQAVTEGILKMLSLSEILPVCLVDSLCLSVAVMDDKLYSTFGRVQGDIEN